MNSTIATNGPPLVEIAGLTKDYGTSSSPLVVLRGLNLDIQRGERVALFGKSGSGKSTLLNLLGGLDVPTSGVIRVDGHDLHSLDSNQRALYRLTTVGMIFQSFYLIPSRTALENVEVPMVLAGLSKKERRQRAEHELNAVGMGHRLRHQPAELSGGERQRVAIARALVNRPRLLLADEPTGNLDTSTGNEVVELLMNYLRDNHAALLLVTHDSELAERCTSRIIRMQDGMLV